MRNLLFILSLLFLTGCYTQLKITYPVKQPRYQVTHLLATNSNGDTTQVHISNFKTIYYNNPTYYSEWKFYWNNRWISPYSYYRYYYRPYQPIYVYYPYPSWNIQSGNQKPQPKVETPFRPRSSGVTRSSGSTTSTRTESESSGRIRSSQSSDSKSQSRSSGSGSTQRRRNN
jgi:hypothetical protein